MMAIESDPLLASLQDELRAQLAALNQFHHPVTPAIPARIAELEQRMQHLREQIAVRRRELAA